MKKTINWKTMTAVVTVLAIFGAGALFGALNKPASVIHVVTVKWNDDATQGQIDAALKGVETLAKNSPGIKNVWTKTLKAQGQESKVTHAFVMEFASEDALKEYADSDAQKEWYKVYVPVRELSRTFDITN